MKRRGLGIAIALALGAGLVAAQEPAPRTAWGHPDLQGTWTNATLTPLQRPPELGDKEFYTPAELAEFAEQRRAATNADRPLRPGEVGSYNDAFFERGSGGLRTGRTSLVIEPRDGRIPALTPAAQAAVERRTARMAAHPADRPSDRWLTERCILFGSSVPMLPEPYNNNYRIFQTPEHVVILVEMITMPASFRSTAARIRRPPSRSGSATRAAASRATRSSSKHAISSSTNKAASASST